MTRFPREFMILALLTASLAFAGAPELEAVLHSPAGRVVMRELGLADGATLGAASSGAEVTRAEEAMQRLQREYLAQHPGERGIFERGEAHLTPAQVESLRALARAQDRGALRDLRFVEASA